MFGMVKKLVIFHWQGDVMRHSNNILAVDYKSYEVKILFYPKGNQKLGIYLFSSNDIVCKLDNLSDCIGEFYTVCWKETAWMYLQSNISAKRLRDVVDLAIEAHEERLLDKVLL